jgi:SAM-dependent methyltransferase
VSQAQKTGEAIWHDIECGAYTADLPLWRELVEATRKRIGRSCRLLELGCGTGRIALALAGPGCEITALDNDSDLIEELRSRARGLDSPVTTVVADARSFDLGSRFDIVIAPMQIVQLLRPHERQDMLACINGHLEPDARTAIAILDPEESWEATGEAAPPPDMREEGGWVYSSQPVAVRRTGDGAAIELDRIRQAVSPTGDLEESYSRIRLELLSPARLERDAGQAGFARDGRRHVSATEDHVGTTVVILRPHDREVADG